MGWARLGLGALVVVAASCTTEPADPGSALRGSDIWTTVDDDLPLLASRERSRSGSAEHGCASLVEVHELAGPDEQVITQLEDVATDEGWDLLYRHPIAASLERQEDLDGPAPQMIVVRPMGETTLHVAFTVLQHPGYDGRWTLVTNGDCRDTDPFAEARERSQD